MTNQRAKAERADNTIGRQVAKSESTTNILQRQTLWRAQADPTSLNHQDLKTLQRTIGNRATVRLLQTKLKLGPAGDKYEQEADQVAAQVVRSMDQTPVQRHEEEANTPQQEEQQSTIARTIAPVQRESFEEEEMVQGKLVQCEALHGPEGGEVESNVAQQIQAARGGGRPLDEGVRSRMESGFGADFSGVRVHTGAQSDKLNRSLNARAFTTGNDIFFGQGQYNPGSNSGQKLIAHELTHTVQQGSAGVQRDMIQRLTFENTNWEAATSARISSGGGGGAFFFSDGTGDPVVVKPTEQFAEESALFSNLFQKTITEPGLDQAGGKKGNEWQMQAPQVRVADPNESQRIGVALNNLLPDSDDDRRIAGAKAALQDGTSPTTVYAYATGQDFSTFSSKTPEGKTPPKEKDRAKVVSQLWKNSGLMTLLGRATAIDIFTGNSDRMLMFNPENFMVEIGKKRKTLTLIDNIFDQAGQGGTFAGIDQFQAWVNKQIPTPNDVLKPAENLANDEFDRIAGEVVAQMEFETQQGQYSFLAPEVIGLMATGFQQNRDRMIQWFSTGLAQGKANLMAAISTIEREMKAQQLTGRPKQVLTHLIARKLVLRRMDANQAWRIATGFNVAPNRANRGGVTLGTRQPVVNN